MKTIDKTPPAAIDAAAHAQDLAERGKMDSFPEEGTDDKILQNGDTGDNPFTDDEALRATEAALKTEQQGAEHLEDVFQPAAKSPPSEMRTADVVPPQNVDAVFSLHDDDADLLDQDRA